MDYFPSPPSSPTPSNFDKVICGACDKPLSSDWFCSDCHKKCATCNRFLTTEHCSRCWMYDEYQHSYVRKPRYFYTPPSYFAMREQQQHHHPYFYGMNNINDINANSHNYQYYNSSSNTSTDGSINHQHHSQESPYYAYSVGH